MRLSVRVGAILALAALLAVETGCLERFERLITHVTYDPVNQTYTVERTLVGVSAGFLLCEDVDSCEAAIWRALAGETNPGYEATIADRLIQRLGETGAGDVKVTLHKNGDSLDVVARYATVPGSRAADDTMIRAEYGGKPGKEQYYLVVEAQPGLDPLPERHTVRKTAGGAGWAEYWVLPPGAFDVSTSLAVDDSKPIFAQIPGLAERIAPWLDVEWILGSPPPKPATAEEPAVSAAPGDDARPAPAATGGWPAPDPTSTAKVWVYDPRVSGYAAEDARAAFAPILPRIEWCYQQRAAAVPWLGGYLFLDAVVQPDGSVSSTSAYGEVPDRELLACANRAIEDWRFGGFAGVAPAQVSIPLALRIEVPPELPGRKHR